VHRVEWKGVVGVSCMCCRAAGHQSPLALHAPEHDVLFSSRHQQQWSLCVCFVTAEEQQQVLVLSLYVMMRPPSIYIAADAGQTELACAMELGVRLACIPPPLC